MPKPAKPARKAPRDPYRMRPCRLCKAQFRPTTHVVSCANTQEFCCPPHRKEYWKYGGLPFDKLLKRMEARTREIAKEEADNAVKRLAEQCGLFDQKTGPTLEDIEKGLRIYEKLTG